MAATFRIAASEETIKKDLSRIDILVCWDVEYDKRTDFISIKGDVLKEKDITTNVYYGVTHYLIGVGRQQPLPIIELKQILKEVIGLTTV
ncbi:MAG: hypothetical protein WBA07_26885 [Rivularia sp. (in: cyanobacteria)]